MAALDLHSQKKFACCHHDNKRTFFYCLFAKVQLISEEAKENEEKCENIYRNV
ncbi:MAG: hypothetical protein IJV33_04195 [Bacteroidaceae bacterium]|nr:hypothetical protein [Bacteroidaceae bacterium]